MLGEIETKGFTPHFDLFDELVIEKSSLKSNTTERGEPWRLLACRFHLATPGMKHRLRVAVISFPSFENQIQGSLKGAALVELRRHLAIVGIAVILAIDDLCHSPERF